MVFVITSLVTYNDIVVRLVVNGLGLTLDLSECMLRYK